MSKMRIGSEICNLRFKVLLGALALVIIVGLGTGVYAGAANVSADNSLSDQTFDPFKLTTATPDTLRTPFRPVLTSNLGNLQPFILLGEMTTLAKAMPAVRIPDRPVLRSCFRPSLIFKP